MSDDPTEALLAQINPPPGGDLTSILGRLNDVTEQLKQITTDVSVHGVAVGRDAVRRTSTRTSNGAPRRSRHHASPPSSRRRASRSPS
jgi:hypothetical protein